MRVREEKGAKDRHKERQRRAVGRPLAPEGVWPEAPIPLPPQATAGSLLFFQRCRILPLGPRFPVAGGETITYSL